MRTLTTCLLLILSATANAEDILKPTKKELLAIADPDANKADKEKAIAKYDGKLAEISGAASLKSVVSGKITSNYCKIQLDYPATIPNTFAVCIVRFGPNTEKFAERIKDNASELKPLQITVYGRIRAPKTGGLVLEGASPDKANAGKLAEKK